LLQYILQKKRFVAMIVGDFRSARAEAEVNAIRPGVFAREISFEEFQSM